VLIYGAGRTGRQLAAAMANSPEMRVVGFLDDDDRLHGHVLNGQPIFKPEDVAHLVSARAISDVLLAMPLARLRGVYQAIASLAFVEVIVALILYFEDLTGGPLGFHNIPRMVTPWMLFAAMVLTMALLIILGRGGIGRAFDAMRQDPAVAASLGVNPTRYHVLSFALSGAIAGLFGGLDALRNFSLTAEQFGFSILIATLSAVVLGGRRTVFGPLVGVAILVLLPEIFRPLAQYRQAVYGLLLVLVMAYLPFGVFDTLLMSLRRRRLARQGMLSRKASSS
jgi:branched-chain amino acid transport system permease protein